MTDPPPIVLSFLKLPPEQQTLFKIREKPRVFMEKLGLLHLALSAYQDVQDAPPCPPRAMEILKNLRETAANQVESLFRVLYTPPEFARTFLRLLDLLEKAPFEDGTLDAMKSFSLRAERMARGAESARDKMASFRQDILAAIREMTSVLDAAGNNGRKTLFTAENSQIVSDLAHAVDECKPLLQELINYYHEMQRHMHDVDVESIKSTCPSPEEIQMIRQRWISFSASVADLTEDMGSIDSQIRLGPRTYDTEVFDLSWFGATAPTTADSPPRDQKSPSTGTRPEPRAISDTANASPHTISPLPPPVSTVAPDKTPRTIRSFLRRVFSCLSIKKFIF